MVLIENPNPYVQRNITNLQIHGKRKIDDHDHHRSGLFCMNTSFFLLNKLFTACFNLQIPFICNFYISI